MLRFIITIVHVSHRFLSLCGVIVLLCLCLTSCGGRGRSSDLSFDKTVYSPRFAEGFEIIGSDSIRSVLIRSFNPWQGADSVATELLVLRNGEKIPPGFKGQVVRGDARRIVAMSTTHVAMLEAVGRGDALVGVSGLEFVSSRDVQARCDSVADIGFDGSVDYELLLSMQPDIVLLYGVNGSSMMEPKLRQLGVPFMYVGDYVEESPLAKAEWVVALAELTGARDKGEAYMENLSSAYDSLRTLAAGVADRPKVMVNTPYADQWFMPSDRSYLIRLISDAGGEYIYKKNNSGTASVPIGMEEAYRLVNDADVWLDVGQPTSLDQLRRACPRFMNAGCVTAGRVYNNNLRSAPGKGNDIYESGAMRPDLILRDLIKIFHSSLLPDTVPMVYYRKLE